MASALLHAAGLRVGAYTSPHIVDYNERIALYEEGERRLADDAQIVAAFEQIESVRGDVSLTYFEYGTLAAAVVFSEAQLDVWVLEVGMGGRLDATNAIEPTAALITNVSLDHCEWLGKDVETIAFEKAGVMRPGIPVVYGDAEVPKAILRHADAVGARLLLRGRDYSLEGVPQPGLQGAFQVANAAAVIALLRAAGLENAAQDELVARVLPQVRLAGRGQRIAEDGVEWLVDVAHNPAAASKLAQILKAAPVAGETVAIIGMLDDKDVEGVVAQLDRHVARWIAVSADNRRSIPAAELARRIANASNRPCLISESPDEALRAARAGVSARDRVLVTGSFYIVSPVLQALGLYSRPES